MSDKTLDIIVGSAMFLLLLGGLAALFIWGFTANTPFGSGAPDEQAGSLVERNGRWVVPSSEVPKTVDGLESGDTLSLLPTRVEAPITEGVKVSQAERAALARTVSLFLSNWETFEPNSIRGKVDRGLPNPYELSIQPQTLPTSLGAISAREDALDPPGVCMDCADGLKWMGGGDFYDSMVIARYQTDSAYVTVTGVVRYRAGDAFTNPRAGQLIGRSYGLILVKPDRNWLVSRAAVDEGLLMR